MGLQIGIGKRKCLNLRGCEVNRENTVEIWERVGFKDCVPITWEWSMNKGKTWEPVEHSFPEIPFVLIKPDPEISQVTRFLFRPPEEE
jgi:hypothetical protein